LKGKYTDEAIEALCSETKTYPIYSSIYISLGIEADLSNYPTPLYFKLKNPIDTGGQIHEYMTARHYCYEKHLRQQDAPLLPYSLRLITGGGKIKGKTRNSLNWKRNE